MHALFQTIRDFAATLAFAAALLYCLITAYAGFFRYLGL
jgi:hypothetical protein